MKSLKTKLGALLAILALTLGLTAIATTPASASLSCSSVTSYTPQILYGHVYGHASCPGSGSITLLDTCVDYFDASNFQWVNGDWSCDNTMWDFSPLFCGVWYRTNAITIDQYGNWQYLEALHAPFC